MPKTVHLAHTKTRASVAIATKEPPASKATLRYREMIPQIEKRDGRLVHFDFDKIAISVCKAMEATKQKKEMKMTPVSLRTKSPANSDGSQKNIKISSRLLKEFRIQ
jgi:hypothetical protein